MNLRGAKPLVDTSIKNFINKIDLTDALYDEDLPNTFKEKFFNWINSSKLNTLDGLESFSNRQLCAGTAQAFDHWYWRHKNRTIRFFKGEFMYHSAVLKHGGTYAYIEDRKLQPNDAVVISVPFSDWGKQREDLEYYLYNCCAMDIPVLLDFAYYPCTKNINLDLDKFKCVDTVTFSISKAFYGAEFLRVGMRLEREHRDDGLDVINDVEMLNRPSLKIALELINNYSVDHNWMLFETLYKSVCEQNYLKETDCIMFGLGGEEYAEYNRGTDVNRVCVSELIGERLNDSSK